MSELETNVQTLIQYDIWKGDFVNYINIDFSYPFVDGDQISFLLEYVPDSLNFKIFNETFPNFEDNVIDPRTYQLFLKFKTTSVTQITELSFDTLLLSFLRSRVYEVSSMVDVVRIRIELGRLLHVQHFVFLQSYRTWCAKQYQRVNEKEF